jgi:hypothetical protein
MSFKMMRTMRLHPLRKLQNSHIDDITNYSVPIEDYLASYPGDTTLVSHVKLEAVLLTDF